MASAVAARGLVLGAALLVLFPTVAGAQADQGAKVGLLETRPSAP